MDDDRDKEIQHNSKGVSSVGMFQKYASGKDQVQKPPFESALEDKPKRKRKVLRLEQIVSFSPIQPGQRSFDISNPVDLELADSIKETGQQDPITVSFLGMSGDQGTYELVNGHRRLGAIRYNAGDQWQGAKIEAEILNSGEDKTLIALHTNRGLMRLSPPQRGELYCKLRDAEKLSVSQICKRYHLDEKEDYINRLMMAWNSPDPVRTFFSRGLPVNRTLDLRGAWNRLPEEWRTSHSDQFMQLSIEGANLFIDRTHSGASPDDAFQEARAISSEEEMPVEDSALSAIGQGETAGSSRSAETAAGAKNTKVVPKEDHILLEPMFLSLGLPNAKINELKRAGGSDSFEELTLAALAVRRGLDLQQSLTGARSLTHSRSLRHIAHRLALDISKVLTKSADVPEYQYLKYILSLSDSRPSAQPTAPKSSNKKVKSTAKDKTKKTGSK